MPPSPKVSRPLPPPPLAWWNMERRTNWNRRERRNFAFPNGAPWSWRRWWFPLWNRGRNWFPLEMGNALSSRTIEGDGFKRGEGKWKRVFRGLISFFFPVWLYFFQMLEFVNRYFSKLFQRDINLEGLRKPNLKIRWIRYSKLLILRISTILKVV